MPPAESVLIGADGTIGIRPVGEDETNIIEVDRLKLVNPDVGDLVKGPTGSSGQRTALRLPLTRLFR